MAGSNRRLMTSISTPFAKRTSSEGAVVVGCTVARRHLAVGRARMRRIPARSRLGRRTARPRASARSARPGDSWSSTIWGRKRLRSRTASALPRLQLKLITRTAENPGGSMSPRISGQSGACRKSAAGVSAVATSRRPTQVRRRSPDGDLTAESLPGPRRRNRTATRPTADKPSQRRRRRPACNTRPTRRHRAQATPPPRVCRASGRGDGGVVLSSASCGRRGTAVVCKHRYRLICRASSRRARLKPNRAFESIFHRFDCRLDILGKLFRRPRAYRHALPRASTRSTSNMPDDAAELESDGDLAAGREVRLDAAHALRRSGDRRAGGPTLARLPRTPRRAMRTSRQTAGRRGGRRSMPEMADLDFIASELPLMLAEHAASLADRLQERLAEVDRRESRLNSQEAEFDSRIRTARLWVEQCEADIAQRHADSSTNWNGTWPNGRSSAAAQFEASRRVGPAAQGTRRAREGRRVAANRAAVGRHGACRPSSTRWISKRPSAARGSKSWTRPRQQYEAAATRARPARGRLYTEQELLAAGQAAALGEREPSRPAARAGSRRGKRVSTSFERRLTEQASELEFHRAELDRDVRPAISRRVELAAAERRLQFRQREIETAIKRFERLGVVEQKMVEAGAAGRRRSRCGRRISTTPRRCSPSGRCSSPISERELEQARLAFENQVTRERRTLVAESERARPSARSDERELQRREQALDQREQSLEQLADQLRAAQRETLETRLATEETWLQLQGVLAPAALTRSIAQVRGRLADQFQLAADDVRQSPAGAGTGPRRTGRAAHGDRRAPRTARSDGSIQQQARNRAAGRRNWLLGSGSSTSRNASSSGSQRRWQAERAEYQQQIQQLLAELRAPSHAAADGCDADRHAMPGFLRSVTPESPRRRPSILRSLRSGPLLPPLRRLALRRGSAAGSASPGDASSPGETASSSVCSPGSLNWPRLRRLARGQLLGFADDRHRRLHFFGAEVRLAHDVAIRAGQLGASSSQPTPLLRFHTAACAAPVGRSPLAYAADDLDHRRLIDVVLDRPDHIRLARRGFAQSVVEAQQRHVDATVFSGGMLRSRRVDRRRRRRRHRRRRDRRRHGRRRRRRIAGRRRRQPPPPPPSRRPSAELRHLLRARR